MEPITPSSSDRFRQSNENPRNDNTNIGIGIHNAHQTDYLGRPSARFGDRSVGIVPTIAKLLVIIVYLPVSTAAELITYAISKAYNVLKFILSFAASPSAQTTPRTQTDAHNNNEVNEVEVNGVNEVNNAPRSIEWDLPTGAKICKTPSELDDANFDNTKAQCLSCFTEFPNDKEASKLANSDIPERTMTMLTCCSDDTAMHSDCLLEYLKSLLDFSKQKTLSEHVGADRGFGLPCPKDTTHILPSELVFDIIRNNALKDEPMELTEKFEKLLQKHRTEFSKQTTEKCPFYSTDFQLASCPTCNLNTQYNACGVTADRVAQCAAGHQFCGLCLAEPHQNRTCLDHSQEKIQKLEEAIKYLQTLIDDHNKTFKHHQTTILSRSALLCDTISACPSCCTAILKDENCNHVTCTSCKHEFCFTCLQPWRDANGRSTHNYFKCPDLHKRPHVYRQKISELSAQLDALKTKRAA